jgi:hypothetical protein
MKIFENKFETKWFVDLEILIRYQVLEKRIMKIWEEPVNTWKDVDGSNIRGFELITVFKDLLKILIIIRKIRSA